MRGRRIGIALAGITLFAAGVALAAKPSALDSSFGKRGVAKLARGFEVRAVAAQKDGKVVVAGDVAKGGRLTLGVARLTKSGRPDRSFNHGRVKLGPKVASKNSVGHGVAIQKDGKVVVAGTATDPSGIANSGMVVERFSKGGGLDRSFGKHGLATTLTGSHGAAHAVALAKGGKIVAAGSAFGADSFDHIALAELDSRGKLVKGFGSKGVSIAQGSQDLGRVAAAHGVAMQGKSIVLAGRRRPNLQNSEGVVARFKASGKLDHGFGKGGSFIVPANAAGGGAVELNALAVGHGGILAGGAASGGASPPAFALAVRLSGGGNPVGKFGKRGIATVSSETGFLTPDPLPGAYGVALARHGVSVLGGFYQDSGLAEVGLWSLDSHGKAIRRGTTRTSPLGSAVSARANALALGRGGRILAAGASYELTGKPNKGLVVAYKGF